METVKEILDCWREYADSDTILTIVRKAYEALEAECDTERRRAESAENGLLEVMKERNHLKDEHVTAINARDFHFIAANNYCAEVERLKKCLAAYESTLADIKAQDGRQRDMTLTAHKDYDGEAYDGYSVVDSTGKIVVPNLFAGQARALERWSREGTEVEPHKHRGAYDASCIDCIREDVAMRTAKASGLPVHREKSPAPNLEALQRYAENSLRDSGFSHSRASGIINSLYDYITARWRADMAKEKS